MNPPVSTEGSLISLKLTPEQHQWLQNTQRFLQDETGCNVSHASILMRLMELGLPAFESELQGLRRKANADKKRFPRLQLVYTQYRPARG